MNEEDDKIINPIIIKNVTESINRHKSKNTATPGTYERNTNTDISNKEYLPEGINLNNYFGGVTADSIRSSNQGDLDKLAKGAGRVISKTVTEIAKIPGYAGGILAAIGAEEGEGWETAFNNQWLKGMNNLNESINEDILPVYKSSEYESLGLGSRLFTPEFWATEGADGLGYMLSAFAPGALVKAAGLGGRLLGGLTEAASLGNTATKGSMLSNLSKIGVTANSVDNVLITVANTYAEAGAEAGNAMENFELGKTQYVDNYVNNGLESLNKQWEQGLINEKEFNVRSQLLQEQAQASFQEQKGRLGRDIFLANAAILLGPNAIQTKLLFGGGASKFVSGAVKPSKPKTFLSGLAGGVLSEGFFEEGMQSTVENMFATSAKKGQLTSNPLDDFNLGEIVNGYTEMLSSTEGQSAVFLGALMGGIMNGVGNMKNAKNDYALTQQIVSNLGSLTSDTMNNVMSIYKKDANGNIIVDEKGNPSHNIQDSKNFVLRHLGAEMLNHVYENAKDHNNESVAKFVKNTYAYDLGRSFINYGEAGSQALNEYLNAEVEAIQNNTKIDKATKDIMLKEAEDTAKIAKKAYRTATANNEAYNLIENQITPDLDLKFKGPNASDQKLKFLVGQRNAFLRNRMFTDLVNDTLEDKYKTLKKTEAIFNPKRKAPSFREIFNEEFTTKKEETEIVLNPLLESLKNDIENLEELEKSLHEDYVNKLSNRDYLMKEMESFSKELTKENIKNVKQVEFEPVANSIANASTLEQLNDIKLDPSLDIFKDDFEAAKAKRKAEIDNLTNNLKKQTKTANQDPGDPNPIVTDTPGIVESTETAEAQASQIEGAVAQRPTNLSERQMTENGYYTDKDGFVFTTDDVEVLSVTEDPSIITKLSAVESDNKQIAEELEAENVLNKVPVEDTNLKTDTQNIDDKGLTTENDGVEADLVATNVTTNNNQSVDLNVDNRANTNGSVNQEIPDDPENNEGLETIDNENSKTFNIYADSIKNDSKVTLEFNVAEGISQNFELRFPRLIIPRKPLVKLLNYINNFRNKAGDVFNVKVNNINNNYQPVQSALRAFEKLKRIQNNSGESLTTQEYEDLLYRLPLNASLSKDNQIMMAIDGIAGDNHAIQDGKIKMTEGSYGFINAFPIRLQIINALLKDVNAPINVTFAKQFAGFLNINRDENGISIQSPLTELKALQDIKNPQERIKYLQDALAYVDLERDVRGLANPDSIITTNASTPGIIYLRLPNRAGTMKNVQLSRRKIEDNASPEDPVSKAYNLAFIIQQSVNLGVNPYEMSLVDFLNTVHEDDSARIYSQFSVPIQILNEHFRGIENISMHSFLNFFTYTSDNLKTKFNFQDGYVQVGKLINKTAIDVTSFVKESNDGLLYISGQDLMNKPEAMDSLRNYFQLLKHNVDKTYAYNPLYIEYLMNEVLTADIKPGEDAFVTNVNTKVRKDGQVLDYKNKLEPNIYINHIVDTPTVDRTLQLSDEIIDRMDPKLRSIVDHVGLEEIVPIEPTVKEIDGTSVIDNEISNLEGKPKTIHNTEDTVIVPVTENNNQTVNKSTIYKIGNTNYRISGDSTKGYTVKHAKTGKVLKSDDKNYKKVLVAHRPDLQEQILPVNEKVVNKLKKFTISSATEYIEANGLTLENAVLLYFAKGGTVSRKGVQENEKGRKWYEGKDGLKASATWETVAESIKSEYPDYNFDEKSLSDEVETVMLSYSSKSELNEDVINTANELRNANEGILSEDDVKNLIYQQGGDQLLSIYEIENAEQNLNEEEKINYYEQEYLKTLNSLPVEDQIKLYEEVDEATPISEYDRRASSEVPSFTESPENISTTSEGFKSFEQSESDLDIAQKEYQNLDHEGKVELIIELSEDVELTQEMWNMLDTEQGSDTLFQQLIDDAVKANQVTKLKNKICDR